MLLPRHYDVIYILPDINTANARACFCFTNTITPMRLIIRNKLAILGQCPLNFNLVMLSILCIRGFNNITPLQRTQFSYPHTCDAKQTHDRVVHQIGLQNFCQFLQFFF